MIMHPWDGHIGWLVLVGQHVDVAVQSLLNAHPVDGIAIGTTTRKSLAIVHENNSTCCALISHTIPVVQGACELAISRETTAYGLRSTATGFGQEALVAIVAKHVGVQQSQRWKQLVNY